MRISWTTALLVILVGLELYPIWGYRFFPSPDGPSHLYNAVVTANYSKVPAYREYYELHVSPAGNLLAHWLLVGLVKIAQPLLAEKLLLTIYVLAFVAAWRWLMLVISPDPAFWTLLVFLFIPNYFLHMGFWNFCLSIPLALFALGALLRGWNWWFAMLALATYSAHAVTWAFLGLAAALWTLIERRKWWLVLCVSVPAPLILLYARRSGLKVGIESGDWPSRILTMRPTFLFAGDVSEVPFIAVCALGLAVLAGVRIWQTRNQWSRPAWLLTAACLGWLLAVFGPDSLNSLSFLRPRFSLFAWICFGLWLGSAALTRWQKAAVLVGLLVAVEEGHRWRMPYYSEWNDRLSMVAQVVGHVRPGSTVIGVDHNSEFDLEEGRVDPARHAIGLLTPLVFLDGADYEATIDYFPVRYRRSPAQLIDGHNPAIVDQYPDYFLFLDHDGSTARDDVNWPILKDYRLTFTSEPVPAARLYERTSAVR